MIAKVTEIGPIYTYDVVTSTGSPDLVMKVNQKIREGWQPYGDLIVTTTGGGPVFLQPMVNKNLS